MNSMTGKVCLVTAATQGFSFSRRAMVLGIGQAAVGTLLAGRMR